MKKLGKILLSIILIVIVLSSICLIIDSRRLAQNKEPIIAINRSGGSVIFYIGPGYLIQGARDDIPGGFKYSKIHSWIWFFVNN